MSRSLRPAAAFVAWFASFVLQPLAHATAGADAGQAAQATPVLEPSTLILVGLGLVGLAVFRSRVRQDDEPED